MDVAAARRRVAAFALFVYTVAIAWPMWDGCRRALNRVCGEGGWDAGVYACFPWAWIAERLRWISDNNGTQAGAIAVATFAVYGAVLAAAVLLGRLRWGILAVVVMHAGSLALTSMVYGRWAMRLTGSGMDANAQALGLLGLYSLSLAGLFAGTFVPAIVRQFRDAKGRPCAYPVKPPARPDAMG